MIGGRKEGSFLADHEMGATGTGTVHRDYSLEILLCDLGSSKLGGFR